MSNFVGTDLIKVVNEISEKYFDRITFYIYVLAIFSSGTFFNEGRGVICYYQ